MFIILYDMLILLNIINLKHKVIYYDFYYNILYKFVSDLGKNIFNDSRYYPITLPGPTHIFIIVMAGLTEFRCMKNQ